MSTASQQQQPKQKDAIQTAYELMASRKDQIEAALPKHLTSTRLLRIVLTELRKTPKLGLCDGLSIMGAVMQAAQLGLEPGGVLGHCYLVPYKKECQLQLGYRGMVDLARRSGNILSIEARCVYEGDDFGVELGTESTIRHRPQFKSSAITHVYAVAKLAGGGVQFDVMSIGEIEHVRDTYSVGYKFDKTTSPWATAPDEMAKKTVVRRLFKMLPTSIEIREAVAIDDDDDQHNAKVIDAKYEVMPPAHDPVQIAAEQAAGGAADNAVPLPADKARAERERRVAIEAADREFRRVMDAGGDPYRVIGIDDGAVLDDFPTEQINVFGDKFKAWKAKA